MLDIPVGRLPRTLLDAVETTMWLGPRYLWVDALCIVQDCELDKEREMARMKHVFQNSYVTIVAAGSRSCNDGFLKAGALWNPITTMSVLCEDGSKGSMLLVERKKRDARDHGHETREPLHSRGWTLQEVVLSPRLLVYGQDCIVWKCFCDERGTIVDTSTGLRSNSDWNAYCASAGLTTIRLSPTGRVVQPRLSLSIQYWDIFTDSAYVERLPKLYRLWNLIVQDYSNRRLTNPKDKLPALSGVVAYFEKGLNDEYVAGMWKQNLLHQLSWTTVNPASTVRPSVWRAPSWSWMSVDGAISFESSRHMWFVPLIQDLTYEVTPVMQSAPFSHLSNGFLKLRGSLVRLSPSIKSCSIILDSQQHGTTQSSLLQQSRKPDEQLWLLLFAKCYNLASQDPKEVETVETAWGLVLLKKHTEIYFKRVGRFSGKSRVLPLFQTNMVITIK